MTALGWIGRLYLEIALGGCGSYLLFRGTRMLFAGRNSLLSHGAWLRLARGLWLGGLLFPILFLALTQEQLPRPTVQIGPSGSGIITKAQWKIEPIANKQLSFRIPNQFFMDIPYGLGIFSLINCVIGISLLLKRRLGLTRYLTTVIPTRTVGGIRVCFSDTEPIAFSTRLSNTAYLVFPKSYLYEPRNLRLALKHESQHHRQKDTRWVWFIELWVQCYRWSPFSRFWSAEMEALQEFACDEALIVRQRVSPQAYGHCLLKAAEMAMEGRAVLAGTTSMARTSPGTNLKRRVQMLPTHQKSKTRKTPLVLVWLGTLGIMATSAYTVRAAVGTQGLTMDEAKSIFARDAEATEIPLNLNELVLDRLNHYIGTEKGRLFMKESRARMPQYQEMIQRKIDQYGLPRELIALPLWESGFLNSSISPGMHARGIWQFIAQTARRYGLVVNDTTDERINPLKETDAAMRYLKDLFDRFQDWRLALKAYNEGEVRVEGLILKYKTRDAWELERLDSRENYLSGAIAMMLLLRHPELMK